MGKNPLYGLGCGSISMIGGPGTAAAIGPDLDAAGAVGGTTVAVAAATFGLIFGSVLGGPIAVILLSKTICARSFPRAASTRRTPTTRTSPRTPTALCLAF